MGPRAFEPAPGPVAAAERGYAGRAPGDGRGGVPVDAALAILRARPDGARH